MTGYLLLWAIEWINIHVGIGRNIFSLYYYLYRDLLPRSWIKNIWNFAHEYGTSLPTSYTQLGLHIEGDLFLMEKNVTTGSRPDNWRSWTNANYTSKSTPSPTSPISTAHTFTNGTMMATKMNFINPPTHGLTKDTQVQKNGNFGVSP